MLSRIIIFLSLSLLFSCSDKPEIKSIDGIFEVKLPAATIGNIETKDWHVGERGKDIVSKGFRFQIKLPQFDHAELQEMLKAGFLDSLAVKLKRRTYSESKTLDTFILPLGRQIPGTAASYIISQLREINLIINYSAASSNRLTNLMCPAMKHRFLLTDYEVNDPMSKINHYVFGKKDAKSDFMSNIRAFNGAKHTINGGRSLIGSYYLEIAFYDSLKRKRVGNFLPSSELLKITGEERIQIPSCDDPKNRDKTQNSGVRSFKFGQ